jgi:transposase
MSRAKKTLIQDVDIKQLQEVLQRVKPTVQEADYLILHRIVETLAYIMQALSNARMSLKRLKKMLFGPASERTADLLKDAGAGPDTSAGASETTPPANQPPTGAPSHPQPPQDSQNPPDPAPPKCKPPGHGRNGAKDYPGARKIWVPHSSLHPGDCCPECREGHLYDMARPAALIRIVGQAPIQATLYERQSLRCNTCCQVFTADPPAGVGTKKYDATAASMVALLRYGAGMPSHRLEGLQNGFGIPLPDATQWDIVEDSAQHIQPVHDELVRQAAQGPIVHNDDTGMKVITVNKQLRAEAAAKPPPKSKRKRTGVFTSGIVVVSKDHRIALYFTGRKHAGENLADVLAKRDSGLPPPIQMCDALARNVPKPFKVILANCLAHGRRKFVDVADSFPQPCLHLLEVLAEVYKHDKHALDENMSDAERLSHHQTHSGPLMEDLKQWLTAQLDDRLVEPNSGLGRAIKYMLNHWEKLTQFLRVTAAPLDNNICERSLKMAIRHRRNSLFYQTVNGAHVGDLFMSLINTCRLNNVDPFDYLTALNTHAARLAEDPQDWMPWNYSETVVRLAKEPTHDRPAESG